MGLIINPYGFAASGPHVPTGSISFVGSGTIAVIGTGAVTFNMSSLRDAAGVQPTTAANDFAIISWANGSQTQPLTFASVSGWTERQTLFVDESINVYHKIFHRVLDGTETSVTLPSTAEGSTAIAVAITVLRGVWTTAPFDVADVVASGINGGVPNPGAITPVTAGSWIVVAGASSGGNGVAFTNPGDLSATTNHFKSIFGNGSTNDIMSGIGLKTDWSSGAFDPATWGGGTSNTSCCWSAVTMALTAA